ncbi:MAG TPA: methanogenesis marker 2 protein [Methanospirillum sp.]|uniref:methanogenesis marker 2 protein n=2 Tax=Methanospirillum sp. TaxID=45200 RepID=UPI002BC4378A|nr:methanogenesis marker 2 protein [Methanospirillum sp.]HOJ95409.1 methanogenesis marker 2 protein [Methanospirillum sp.]HOL40362.1 methanogenesis marker 2 protein [Methanospirillum sp.]
MGEYTCSTEQIAQAVRTYDGVKRKSEIGAMVRDLQIDSPAVVASFGDDAAVIRNGSDALLLAADGIWSKLMDADPYWAGYCAVLVNIHDIAAMGGKPLAMVDVFSISDEAIKKQVISGMHDASRQFGVPVVGGHLHPDTPYSVIDVAILGIAPLENVIYSNTACTGDAVLIAIDLNGRVHPSCILNWDSATLRTADEVRGQIAVMQEIGSKKLVTAGKDISNPGIIGTLGMLLEVSGKGADIDLAAIPHPDLSAHSITFDHWLKMYPGMGFILTARHEHINAIRHLFRDQGMTVQAIGTVNDTGKLRIFYHDSSALVFDFSINGGVMHLGAYPQ